MSAELIKIRKLLHQNPELANQENETANVIEKQMLLLNPDDIFSVASTGKVYVVNGTQKGPTTVFRADMDALPIEESNEFPHASKNKGVAHLCGHDGHMTIVLGLAQKIAKNPPKKGRVAFLFQPAEESEQGARDVVNDPNFKALAPDYIFGLHNIPGEKKHSIIVREGSFAAASKGMTIKFFGKTSHAAEPEFGKSPLLSLARISLKLNELNKNTKQFSELTFLTVIHIQLGEIAFGTSPGYAEMRLTLRSFNNEDMKLLSNKTEQIIKQICAEEDIHFEFSYSEEFPTTTNHPDCYSAIIQSAKANSIDTIKPNSPFRWSEDFGYYSEKYKTGFFGLGAGVSQPALHNPDYDFPDEITSTGIQLFYNIYKSYNQ